MTLVDEPTAAATLTPREQQLVALLMHGLSSSSALADAMTVSEHTVHYHVAEVLRKLHVSDRAQVVSYAWRTGRVVGGRWTPNP